MDKVDFVLVGVGGQGTILASDILAGTGLHAGYDVKKSEVHGMSQRGGSVTSQVRWAEHVHSPLIGQGEADLMLAFEKLEAVRFASLLRPGGVMVVNDHAIPPVSVSAGNEHYPADDEMRRVLLGVTPHIHVLPAARIARDLGNARVENVVLLGALSRLVEIDASCWLAALEERVPERTREVNRAAFLAGREAIGSPISS